MGSSPIARPNPSDDPPRGTGRRRRLAGLALAGGAARRMGGGDKPLLELGGRSMLAWVIDGLRAETALVAISANGDPDRFAAFGLPVLPDGVFTGAGPLAGLLAGLDWAAGHGAEALLSLPGDTPFAPRGLADALAPAPACAASRGRAHGLVALWPVAAREKLRAVLSVSGPRSVRHFAEQIGMRTVAFAAAPHDPFLNVNTAAELDAARQMAARFG